jgi:hypothetical protein
MIYLCAGHRATTCLRWTNENETILEKSSLKKSLNRTLSTAFRYMKKKTVDMIHEKKKNSRRHPVPRLSVTAL